MIITTTTKIEEYFPYKEQDITVTVEHDADDEQPYRVSAGCIDEWFDEADLRRLVKLLNKALLIRKRAIE